MNDQLCDYILDRGVTVKILYVLPETPMIGGAGIATYLKHAARAQKRQGHSLSILTWYFANNKPPLINKTYLSLFDSTRFVEIRGEEVCGRVPNGPWQIALSHFLARDIISFVRELRPDVIETSDYQIPLYGYLVQRRAGLLQDLQNIRFYRLITAPTTVSTVRPPSSCTRTRIGRSVHSVRCCDGLMDF